MHFLCNCMCIYILTYTDPCIHMHIKVCTYVYICQYHIHILISNVLFASVSHTLFQSVNFFFFPHSSSHQVAKVLSFSFSISPSNEHPGLISFRMDWLDFLAVQGTLKSLIQDYGSVRALGLISAHWCVVSSQI